MSEAYRETIRRTPEERANRVAEALEKRGPLFNPEIETDDEREGKLATQSRVVLEEIARQRDLREAEERMRERTKGSEMIGKGGIKAVGDTRFVGEESGEAETFIPVDLSLCSNGVAATVTVASYTGIRT